MRKEKHLELSFEKCQHAGFRKKKMNEKETGSSRQRGRKEVRDMCDISQKAREVF